MQPSGKYFSHKFRLLRNASTRQSYRWKVRNLIGMGPEKSSCRNGLAALTTFKISLSTQLSGTSSDEFQFQL